MSEVATDARTRARSAPDGLGRIYRVCRWLARLACRLYLGHHGRGIENVPSSGAFLLAVNHASYLDPVLAGVECPRGLFFVARRSLFEQPLFGWLIRSLNSLPIQRGGVSKETIQVVLGELRSGHAVLLFPEGTRSVDGRLGELKSGVARIAQLAGVPIVPALVLGSHRALGRSMRWPRPARTQVRYGAPFAVPRDADPQEVTNEIRRRWLELAGDEGNTLAREDAPVG